MKCPFCGSSNTQVLESRVIDDGQALRRRRKCLACQKRFTTYERARNTLPWVVKKDGRRELFNREKIKKGLLRAIEKRPVSLDLIEEITSQVEQEMLRQEKEEIPSRLIGRAVLKRLKKIDKVAWLRFVSVYLKFEELGDFKRAIEKGI